MACDLQKPSRRGQNKDHFVYVLHAGRKLYCRQPQRTINVRLERCLVGRTCDFSNPGHGDDRHSGISLDWGLIFLCPVFREFVSRGE